MLTQKERMVSMLIKPMLKKISSALVGAAQWIDCQLANQSVAGSIPSQGTYLGCGPGPQLGGM